MAWAEIGEVASGKKKSKINAEFAEEERRVDGDCCVGLSRPHVVILSGAKDLNFG